MSKRKKIIKKRALTISIYPGIDIIRDVLTYNNTKRREIYIQVYVYKCQFVNSRLDAKNLEVA